MPGGSLVILPCLPVVDYEPCPINEIIEQIFPFLLIKGFYAIS